MPFREVIDLMTIDHDIIPAEHAGPVSGVSLIGGEPAELVDAHWLFASHLGAGARSADQPVCRLPSDDPWMQNMLRPIVEAAGYLVVGDDDELIPDLVIASGPAGIDDRHADRTLVLPRPNPAGPTDGSIYRYDRAGLLSALKARAGGEADEPVATDRDDRGTAASPFRRPRSKVVVELDALIPVPRAAPHVAGLSALRSRVLTVIDCQRSLELGSTDCSDGHPRGRGGRARRPSLCPDRR